MQELTDTGHKNLINDLKQLLYEAHNGEFHDFANQKYPAPKMALAEKLGELTENVIDGKYDN